MKDHRDEKSEPMPDAVCSSCGRQGGFKKRNGKSNVPSNDNDYFRGLSFKIGKDRPNLYEKTINWLALHSSTQFKNGSDIVVCLRLEEYV